MASLDTNGCKPGPLDGAQKCIFISFSAFLTPSSGQQLQLLASRDSKYYGAFNEYLFVNQKCTQPC